MRKKQAKKVELSGAERIRIGVVVSRYLEEITDQLLQGALSTLKSHGVADESINIIDVSGSFEIPYGCLTLLSKSKPDAIIALGCIVKGETNHDRYIASAVSHGIMQLSLQYKTPISFGVITTNTLKQAKARSSGDSNKGTEAAIAALQSALLKARSF